MRPGVRYNRGRTMFGTSLNGSLEAFTISDVLTFLQSARKTGMLTVANGANEAYVFFRGGELVYAASNQETLRLGAILLRKKRISREQAAAIDDTMLRGAGHFGDMAVERHMFNEAELADALKLQVAEVVFDAFVWHDGTFAFYDGFDLPPNAVTITADLPNLIMEGARRIEEWEQCFSLLPDSSVVFRVVSDPDIEKITLTSDEWKTLFLVNGQRTLEQLCRDSGDDTLHVYRLVYGLVSSKLIEPISAEPEAEPAEEAPTRPMAARADETVRQSAAEFDATIREPRDDNRLLISPDAKLSYHDVVKPTVGQMTIVAGQPMGAMFPLTNPEYLLGRHRDNSIQLADVGVSSYHARIYRGPDGYVIEDLKSRNGVWLNGDRVFHAVLKKGDRVRLGSTDLEYDVLFG